MRNTLVRSINVAEQIDLCFNFSYTFSTSASTALLVFRPDRNPNCSSKETDFNKIVVQLLLMQNSNTFLNIGTSEIEQSIRVKFITFFKNGNHLITLKTSEEIPLSKDVLKRKTNGSVITSVISYITLLENPLCKEL